LRSQIIELEKIEKLRDHFNATWNKIEQNIEKKVEIHQKIKKIQKSNKKRQQNWGTSLKQHCSIFKKKKKLSEIV